MKKLILLTALSAILLCSLRGQASQNYGDYYDAFIMLNGAVDESQLSVQGIIVTGAYDGFYTAKVLNTMTTADVAGVPGIARAFKALKLETCSDSARFYSHVDDVHKGTGFSRFYNGNGVIVGVIDCGFDFNHINLCDANGIPRVKAVYMPLDYTGTAPKVNGRTLPGSCYETLSQIARLTTDDKHTTHGTQTAGIAAGAYRNNNWYGMAPGADIVACGMPEGEINDVRVANCISYIMDYAERMHKPCVINISLGTNVGSHDGSSFVSRVCEQYTGPGRVCVVSAGNDGSVPVCARMNLTVPTDTATMLLAGYGGGLYRSGNMSVCSNESSPLILRMIVVDHNTGDIVYRSKLHSLATVGEAEVFSSATDAQLARYYTGTVSVVDGHSVSGRRNALCAIDMTANSSNYILGFQLTSPTPTNVVAWTSQYAYFHKYGFDWAVEGTRSSSINELATTDSVISVGSYNTRQYIPLADGTIMRRGNSTPMEISYYSAYGPDENGIARPDVCAPGSVVIASANRYDTDAPNKAYWQTPAVWNNVAYPYCPDLGTSMSAPVVTGAVALWLQANPKLGVADVRTVLAHSSYKDDQVKAGDPARWGTGKLDVNAGMRYILHLDDVTGDVNGDREVNISDINAVISIILGGSVDADAFRRADVNGDGEVNISDINAIIDIILSA